MKVSHQKYFTEIIYSIFTQEKAVVLLSQVMYYIGRFQKISIPIPWTAFRISEGEGGSLNWNSKGMGGIYDWKSEGMGGFELE